MQQPTVWDGEASVNLTMTTGNQLNTKAVALEGGGYVIVWEDVAANQIRAQLFDSGGSAVGQEFQISNAIGGLFTAPDVAALPGGGFVVVWNGDQLVPNGSADIHAAIFDGQGTKVVDDFAVNLELDPANPTAQHDPVVTALESGGFVVAWLSDDLNGPGGPDPMWTIQMQKFDQNGNPRATQTTAAAGFDNDFKSLAISEAGDNQIVLTWTTGDNVDQDIGQRRFTTDFDPASILPFFAPDIQQFVSVAVDGNGNYLSIARDAGTSTGQQPYGLIGVLQAPDGSTINPNGGNPAIPFFAISDDTENGTSTYDPKVTGLHTGGFFVTWAEYNAGAFVLVGQLLSTTGTKIGGELFIKQGSINGEIRDVSVDELSDGRLIVAWADDVHDGADGSGLGIKSIILDPRANLIYGTEQGETIEGTTYGSGTGNDTIYALGGHDSVYGSDGDDSIFGGAGNDTLNGGDDDDTMAGGLGDDLFLVNSAGDVIVEANGQGHDKVITMAATFSLGATAEVEEIEIAGGGNVTGNEFAQLITGDNAQNDIVAGGGNDTLDGGEGVDALFGGTGDDTYYASEGNEDVHEAADEGIDTVIAEGISFSLEFRDNFENLTLVGGGDLQGTGNDLNNVITGNGNDNTLYGKNGNDTLIGGEAADTMYGGDGDDTYEVDHVNDEVVELNGEGTDTVNAIIDHTLDDEVENLNLKGSAVAGTGNELANVITGNSAGNTLNGLDGNDTIDGQGGNDAMAGGRDDDTYHVGESGDVVTELGNEGTDTVIASVDYTLGDNIEVLSLVTGTSATGNGGANTITGNAGANVIDGKAGADTMTGRAGDDQYVVDNAGDVVVEVAKGGFDTVTAFVDHTLGAFVEKLVLAAGTNATGNNLANEIVGNAAANIIDGKFGSDTMIGLAGDDTYVVDNAGDVVVEAVNGGTDIVLAFLDYALTDNVENLTLIAGTNATGNALANALVGNGGDNELDGQGGTDTMTGGLGNDDYIVADAGDVVVEDANSGTDTVHAAVNSTLGTNLETLVLTGNAAKGTGNDVANTLIGNALANTLKGGRGNDTMDGGDGKDALEGGKGNDTYVLGGGNDKVTDGKGADDTITSTITRKLADFAGIENLKLEGTAKINGTGTAADNDLVGNSAKNQLKGEAGSDLLRGLGGADQLWGGAGKDTFDFDAISDIKKASGKRDIVKDFQHGQDKIDLSTIDANGLLAGDQKFKFKAVEGSAFTGVAGQLIWDQKDGAGTSHDMTLVSGDINGDGVADFTLELSGLVNLTKGDFIL